MVWHWTKSGLLSDVACGSWDMSGCLQRWKFFFGGCSHLCFLSKKVDVTTMRFTA
ncbi:hypothetical protein Lalb_Chr02g0145881 [Lupinus albus]|uniref:Uncharacterized protein n=1 Tax=Lupinus albus TaxID=3870 RepID=A0A6A4QY63_LUPAL|nr:hypothetical protein Lalb_Chr02g0145881 [Lupinus albus]